MASGISRVVVVVMAVVALGVAGLSMGFLYEAALNGRGERLREVVDSQACLIDAIYHGSERAVLWSLAPMPATALEGGAAVEPAPPRSP